MTYVEYSIVSYTFLKILEYIVTTLSGSLSREFSNLSNVSSFISIVDDKVNYLEYNINDFRKMKGGKDPHANSNTEKIVLPLFENLECSEKTGYNKCHNCFTSLCGQPGFVFQKHSVCILCIHCANLYGLSLMGEDICVGKFMRTENTRNRILSALCE